MAPSFRWLCLLCVVGGLACRKPAVTPSFEDQLGRAADQGGASEKDREAYLEGFRNGARMVEAAVTAGRRPYLLTYGRAEAALPSQALPGGAAVVQETAPQTEVDPDTGLELRRLGDPAGPAYSRGQVEGFRWAFARRRATLVQPLPPPPAPARWERMKAAGPMTLTVEGLRVEVRWNEEALWWSSEEQGFPLRRMWRPLGKGQRPRALGLGGGALWVDTEAGALALDLMTGAIRALGPHAPAPSGDVLDDPAFMARERRAHAERRPALLAAAAEGKVEAMLELGYGSEELEQSAAWFRKAAEAGDPQGMFEWAVCCYQGQGVPKNQDEARTWFGRAAKAGHAGATEVMKGLFGGS